MGETRTYASWLTASHLTMKRLRQNHAFRICASVFGATVLPVAVMTLGVYSLLRLNDAADESLFYGLLVLALGLGIVSVALLPIDPIGRFLIGVIYVPVVGWFLFNWGFAFGLGLALAG